MMELTIVETPQQRACAACKKTLDIALPLCYSRINMRDTPNNNGAHAMTTLTRHTDPGTIVVLKLGLALNAVLWGGLFTLIIL